MKSLLRLSLVLYAYLLSACNTNSDDKKFKVVFLQCVQDDIWRETMLLEMKRELSFHPEIEFEFLDAEGNSKKQIDQLDKLSDKQFDLLIISPNESDPLTPAVNRIFQKGKPIIVVDRKTSSEFYTVYIGSDNYQVGKLAAEYIIKDDKVNQLSKILYITGLKSSSASIEREKGFTDVFQNNKQYSLYSLESDWRPETALKEIKTLPIDEISSLSYIFCFNDRIAVAISEYLKNLKLEQIPKIIGVDGLAHPNNGLEYVKNRDLSATVLYPTGGKETIRVAKQILNKEDFRRIYDLGTVVIDTSNVDILLGLEHKLQDQYEDIDKQQTLLKQLAHSNNLEKYKSNILLILLVLSILGICLTIYILIKLRKSKKTISLNNDKIQEQYNQLTRLNNELNTAFNSRVDLFRNLSYSLKNPIAILVSLKKELKDYTQIKASHIPSNLIHALTNVINRLSNIYTDIQHLENIELRSPTNRNIESTDINHLIIQVIYQLKPISESKGLKFKIQNNLVKKQHMISRIWVERGLFNLFDYLIKVASFDADVFINLSEAEDTKHKFIFDIRIGPFKDHSLVMAMEEELGLGIGVIFFQEVIKLHEGKIMLDSIGQQFHIYIEMTELKNDNNVKSTIDPYIKEFNNIVDNFSPSFHLNKKILIIDPDNSWAEILKFKFQDTLDIISVYNYEQGIEFLKNNPVNLIITESKIHHKYIFDYTDNFQEQIHNHLVPCIVFSSIDSHNEVLKITQNITMHIIFKKFGIQTLIAAIDRIFKEKEFQTQKLLKLTDKDLELVASSSLNNKQKKFIQELDEVIGKNISDPKLNVNQLAKLLNISRVNLYKKCLEILNKKPSDYIIEKRINKATFLLKTDLNISEVAYQSGFTSPAYFSKVFTAVNGINPKDFKKLN